MAQKAEKFLLSRVARFATIVLVALGLWHGLREEWLPATAALAAAGFVWATPAGHAAHDTQPWPTINRGLALFLCVILLTSLWTGPVALSYWLYTLPLLTFAVLPLKFSAVLTTVLVVAVSISVLQPGAGAYRHQFVATFFLTTALSLVLVFLREYKSRQLAPLRRTDELTQAASREYLTADLHKEIQRSEREGTDMAIVLIGLDIHLSDATADDDIRAILPRIGRFLHSQLRDFDSYYRMADLQFLIILPGKPTADASMIAERIRKGLRELLTSNDLDLTVSAGIAGLNIGDDADSLQNSAANALRRAQQRGGNRVQSYTAWSETPQPQPGDR